MSGQVERNPGPAPVDTTIPVNSQSAQMELKLNKLMDMMDDMKSQFISKLQRVEDHISVQCEQLRCQFADLQNFVSTLQSSLKNTELQVNNVKKHQTYLDSRLRRLEDEVERQERYSRRCNLLLYGMPEERGETYEKCLERVIQSLNQHFPQKTWSEDDIDRAHRLGSLPAVLSRPRPVIVKFFRWRDYMIIMKDRKGKDQMRASEGIRVAADLTRQQRDTMAQYQQEGKHAYYSKGKLVVTESRRRQENGSSYRDSRPHPNLCPPDGDPHSLSCFPTLSQILTDTHAATQGEGPPVLYPGQTEDADDVSVADDLAVERGPDGGQRQDSTDTANAWSVEREDEQPGDGQGSSSQRQSPSLLGFGRGSPVNTPTTQPSSASKSQRDGGGGRGRGKSHAANEGRSVSRRPSAATPVHTRQQSLRADVTTSTQGKLPKDWSQNPSTKGTAKSGKGGLKK